MYLKEKTHAFMTLVLIRFKIRIDFRKGVLNILKGTLNTEVSVFPQDVFNT